MILIVADSEKSIAEESIPLQWSNTKTNGSSKENYVASNVNTCTASCVFSTSTSIPLNSSTPSKKKTAASSEYTMHVHMFLHTEYVLPCIIIYKGVLTIQEYVQY